MTEEQKDEHTLWDPKAKKWKKQATLFKYDDKKSKSG